MQAKQRHSAPRAAPSLAPAEAKTEESAILRNGHQNLLVVRPKSIISSLLYI
jgi:hypothetical protein